MFYYSSCRLFGGKLEDLPNPDANWEEFFEAVKSAKHDAGKTWDVTRGRMAGWINMRALERGYGRGGKCTIM
jgi:hypothetical protein